MKVTISRLIVATLFLFSKLAAQDVKVVQDLRTLAEIEVKKKITRNWTLGVESDLKFEKNSSRIKDVALTLAIEYQPLKFLDLAASYKLINNHKNNGSYELQQRIAADITYKYKLARFKFGYRVRYQNSDDDLSPSENLQVTENYLRNRLKTRYNLKGTKLTPFAYIEHYGIFDDMLPYGHKLKLAGGVQFPLYKDGDLSLYYRLDHELNDDHPFNYSYLGIAFSHDF